MSRPGLKRDGWRPWSSDRVVAVLDFVVDAAVVAFALWTVVFHLAVSFDWHRNLAVAMWCLALLVAGAAFLRARGRRAEPNIADASSTPSEAGGGNPRVRRLGVRRSTAVVFIAAAAGIAALGGYSDSPALWWAFSALVVVFAVAAVLVVSRTSGSISPGNRSPSWPAVALVIALAAVFALGSAFTQRPDADDVSYLTRAVHAEQRSGLFATRDTVYSDQAYAISVVPPSTPLTAIEPLTGVLALLTPYTSPTIAYLVVGPVVSGIAVLALWRLLRTLGAPSPALATLGAALFLVLNGNRHASFGNFSFVRSWQGKAIFVGVVVPLIWHYALAWGKGRGRSSWVGLLAANTAGVGLTTTAYLVAPTITALALACSARGREAKRRILIGASTLAYPLAVLFASRIDAIPSPTREWDAGGMLGFAVGPVASVVGTVRTGARAFAEVFSADNAEILRSHWDRILGDGLPAIIAVGSLLVAWLFVRDRAGRFALAAVPAVLILLYFNPAAAQIPENAGSFERAGGSWWRSVWVAPVPVAVGITVSSGVLVSRAWMRRALTVGLPLTMAVAMLVGGITVLSPDNRGVRIGSLEWDVEPVPRAAAARALSLAERSDLVAAPQEVGEVLTVMTANVHPLMVRDLEYAVPVFKPESQVQDRRVVHEAIVRGLDLDHAPAFRAALAALDIRVVVAARGAIQHGSLATVLDGAGFIEAETDAHYSYWLRR